MVFCFPHHFANLLRSLYFKIRDENIKVLSPKEAGYAIQLSNTNLLDVRPGTEYSKDFERKGPEPFLFAGIGGLSEFLGWTDQQRVAAANEGWSYRLVFSARLVGLVLLADGLFLGAQQIGSFLQDMKSP
ncbi:hypothetical protein H6P81_013354 [Aristolochia fimbriata]|uniref:Uncharacterized protein n=1 Tax=Aristolochia fimbriata TaxID=158543 RepID=A0AAV7EHN3_ARIFI|nr:hypothetical protein H6P81_013354 [Aristolochia fimbriata]